MQINGSFEPGPAQSKTGESADQARAARRSGAQLPPIEAGAKIDVSERALRVMQREPWTNVYAIQKNPEERQNTKDSQSETDFRTAKGTPASQEVVLVVGRRPSSSEEGLDPHRKEKHPGSVKELTSDEIRLVEKLEKNTLRKPDALGLYFITHCVSFTPTIFLCVCVLVFYIEK